MKLALSSYRPLSNWTTMALLTLAITGFGLFAQHRIDGHGQTLVNPPAQLMSTQAGHR